MQDELTHKLGQLGLSLTESKLYQVGLASATSVGVMQLQKETAMKRPTIYHALDTLAAKGLVAKVKASNRQLYNFTPPAHLERLAEQEIADAQRKLRLAVQIAPELDKVTLKSGTTLVSHYEGIEGVKAVVDIALYCKKTSWDIIAPSENFFSEFDRKYAKYYLNTRRYHGIKSRTIWEEKIGTRPLSKVELAERNPRYMPKLMQGRFSSTMILFDNKVAIISSIKNLSAILITSDELNNFFETMFEGLWSISVPYKDFNE